MCIITVRKASNTLNFLQWNLKYDPNSLLLSRLICHVIQWRHLRSISTERQGRVKRSTTVWQYSWRKTRTNRAALLHYLRNCTGHPSNIIDITNAWSHDVQGCSQLSSGAIYIYRKRPLIAIIKQTQLSQTTFEIRKFVGLIS